MIFTVASLSLPTRPRSPKRCPNSPKKCSQSIPKGSPEQPRSSQGRPRSIPGDPQNHPRAFQADLWPSRRPLGVLSDVSGLIFEPPRPIYLLFLCCFRASNSMVSFLFFSLPLFICFFFLFICYFFIFFFFFFFLFLCDFNGFFCFFHFFIPFFF